MFRYVPPVPEDDRRRHAERYMGDRPFSCSHEGERGCRLCPQADTGRYVKERPHQVKACRDDDKLHPLAVAFDLKEDFFNIYDDNRESRDNAEAAFAEWEKSIPEDEIYAKFRDLAATVHNFYEQIFNAWDCPIAISNGFTECTNRLIRENNTRGRGYSFDVLRGRTLYRKTNLQRVLDGNLALIGPEIPADGPVFYFEGTEEDDESDDVDFDPDTGEIFE